MEILAPFQKQLLKALERVKLDFAQDTPYRLRPLQVSPSFGIHVDSAINIAANKLAALLDRAAEKNFVDVFFIHQELVSFAELLPLARELMDTATAAPS
jgi:hypothetical protein